KNRGIVVGSYIERQGGKTLPVFQGGCATGRLEQFQQSGILLAGGDDQHIPVVLCRSADEGYSTDVDLFDDVLFAATLCHGLFKRVEVDDDKINRLDPKGL